MVCSIECPALFHRVLENCGWLQQEWHSLKLHLLKRQLRVGSWHRGKRESELSSGKRTELDTLSWIQMPALSLTSSMILVRGFFSPSLYFLTDHGTVYQRGSKFPSTFKFCRKVLTDNFLQQAMVKKTSLDYFYSYTKGVRDINEP